MNKVRHIKLLEIFTGLFFIIDRLSKVCALKLKSLEPIALVSGSKISGISWVPDLYFRLVFNRGISWGIFNSKANLVFIMVSICICLITFGLLRYIIFKYRNGLTIFPESLIFLGSLSNIADRFLYGGVIDFIEIDFGSWLFPIFNLADCGIVFGVFLMLLDLASGDHSKKHDNV